MKAPSKLRLGILYDMEKLLDACQKFVAQISSSGDERYYDIDPQDLKEFSDVVETAQLRLLAIYSDDVDRIISVCKRNGYDISRYDAQVVWNLYSKSLFATWLTLPEDDDTLFKLILMYGAG